MLTPTLGPGASLEELQLKAMLCDPLNYPTDLPIVYEKLNMYCKLRQERRRMTKADDKEITFRKEVTLMVSRVNTARTIRRTRQSKRDGK